MAWQGISLMEFAFMGRLEIPYFFSGMGTHHFIFSKTKFKIASLVLPVLMCNSKKYIPDFMEGFFLFVCVGGVWWWFFFVVNIFYTASS